MDILLCIASTLTDRYRYPYQYNSSTPSILQCSHTFSLWSSLILSFLYFFHNDLPVKVMVNMHHFHTLLSNCPFLTNVKLQGHWSAHCPNRLELGTFRSRRWTGDTGNMPDNADQQIPVNTGISIAFTNNFSLILHGFPCLLWIHIWSDHYVTLHTSLSCCQAENNYLKTGRQDGESWDP